MLFQIQYLYMSKCLFDIYMMFFCKACVQDFNLIVAIILTTDNH